MVLNTGGVRRRLWSVTSALVMLGTFAIGGAAHAHHSAVEFDSTKELEFSGTVKSFLWTNPHSLLVVLGTRADGELVDFSAEMNGPGYLARNGWKRDSLKPGDKVTLTVHPLLNGKPGGDLVKVVLADGRSLVAWYRPPADAPAGDKQ